MLLRTSTERMTLAVFGNEGLLNEKRRKADKGSMRSGKDTMPRQGA